MQTDNIFIIQPDTTEQASALKAFVKALKMKFEVAEKPYNPDFVAKIMKSEQEFKQGKTKRVKKEDLSNFLGL